MSINIGDDMLIELNKFIHFKNKMFNYHMKHIMLVRKYALVINNKLKSNISNRKLSFISLSHDLFKERSLNPKLSNVMWENYNIPQDTTRYVRENLNILEEFDLDEYFNTDMQYHALSAAIFLIKEIGIKDPEIIYPVAFHSCPIIPVYENLPYKTRTMIDIIMLSDKLSSNYLKINFREVAVRTDLDKMVFGINGNEFNYTFGLFIARLISQGKSEEEQSVASTNYYYNRLCEVNPMIPKNFNIKMLGGAHIWEKRKSRVLQMQSHKLRM